MSVGLSAPSFFIDIFLSNMENPFLVCSGFAVSEFDRWEDVSEHSALSFSLELVPSSCRKQLLGADEEPTSSAPATPPLASLIVRIKHNSDP
uniref:Uncharacterized protein n=1 Tax=Arundo donax TaxID=35708 RepID=A0A0A9B1H6_ARUDO